MSCPASCPGQRLITRWHGTKQRKPCTWALILPTCIFLVTWSFGSTARSSLCGPHKDMSSDSLWDQVLVNKHWGGSWRSWHLPMVAQTGAGAVGSQLAAPLCREGRLQPGWRAVPRADPLAGSGARGAPSHSKWAAAGVARPVPGDFNGWNKCFDRSYSRT